MQESQESDLKHGQHQADDLCEGVFSDAPHGCDSSISVVIYVNVVVEKPKTDSWVDFV